MLNKIIFGIVLYGLSRIQHTNRLFYLKHPNNWSKEKLILEQSKEIKRLILKQISINSDIKCVELDECKIYDENVKILRNNGFNVTLNIDTYEITWY
jgi:hypothetical protein